MASIDVKCPRCGSAQVVT
ncbi:MAG: hypothetical protein LBD58_12775 [Treponema sp.]|nr:hypothetical protein [Treponema sp.]